MFEIESIVIFYELPRRFPDSRQHAFISQFPETNTTDAKVPHKSIPPPTAKTSVFRPSTELRLLFTSRDDWCFCHK